MYGAQIAFKEFNVTKGINGSPWVGLAQFERFFQSHEFWRLLKNTFSISLYTLIASFPFPIMLALGLNYVRNRRFKNTVQMVTYAPYFISLVVLVGLIRSLWIPERDSSIRCSAGSASVRFTSWRRRPGFSRSMCGPISGRMSGFPASFLATLSGIDPALHEATVMDGATKMRGCATLTFRASCQSP